MKRIFAMFLVLACLCSCTEKTEVTRETTEETTEETTKETTEETFIRTTEETSETTTDMVGGWEIGSYDINGNNEPVFTAATEDLTDVTLTPALYLGSQLVAGTNHCFLAHAADPDGLTYWAAVYIYEDLSGNCELTKLVPIDIDADSDGPQIPAEDFSKPYNWNIPDTADLQAEELNMYLDATEAICFECVVDPVAYLGSNGDDHCFLEYCTPVDPAYGPFWSVAHILEYGDGSLEYIGGKTLDIGYLN